MVVLPPSRRWRYGVTRARTSLYISYPISWTFVVIINGLALYLLFRKLIRYGEPRDRYGSPVRK